MTSLPITDSSRHAVYTGRIVTVTVPEPVAAVAALREASAAAPDADTV